MSPELYRDRDWLFQKYVVEGLSLSEIGALAGCHSQTAFRWAKKHGIPTRPRSECLTERSKGRIALAKRAADERRGEGYTTPLSDKEWLLQKYESEGLSIYDISLEAGCRPANVATWLKKHSIQARGTLTERGKVRRSEGAKRWRQHSSYTPPEITPELREKMNRGIKEFWSDPDNRAKAAQKLSERSKRNHAAGKYRNNPNARTTGGLVNKDDLYQWYVVEGQASREIAERVGCSYATVLRWLGRFGIPIRPGYGGRRKE